MRKDGNLIKKVVKLHPQQKEMLEEVVDKWGILNESEAIRQAITYWYRKMSPEYLKLTPRQQERQEMLKMERRIEEMSGEEYATDVMNARIMTATDGKKFAVLMSIANGIKVFPVEQVKDIDKQDSFYKETHLRLLSEGADFDSFLENNKFRLEQSNILLDENRNRNKTQWNEKAQEEE